MLNFIKNISPTEWVVIGLILIVLFGAKIITGMAKTSGESIKQIKNIKKSFNDAIKDDDTKSS